jgi:hypothetical protein
MLWRWEIRLAQAEVDGVFAGGFEHFADATDRDALDT